MNSDKKWTTTTAYVRNTWMFGIYSISSVQFRAMYRLAAATATVCVRVWFDNNWTKQSDNWDIDQSHEEMPTVCTPVRPLSCQLITPGKAQNVGPLSAAIRPAKKNVPQFF